MTTRRPTSRWIEGGKIFERRGMVIREVPEPLTCHDCSEKAASKCLWCDKWYCPKHKDPERGKCEVCESRMLEIRQAEAESRVEWEREPSFDRDDGGE